MALAELRASVWFSWMVKVFSFPLLMARSSIVLDTEQLISLLCVCVCVRVCVCVCVNATCIFYPNQVTIHLPTLEVVTRVNFIFIYFLSVKENERISHISGIQLLLQS